MMDKITRDRHLLPVKIQKGITMDDGFLPKKDYKQLISYQKSVIIYEFTYIFCNRFFTKFDRTKDQMVQAARSGKQNIVEGSIAGKTSTETEIKLTNVARASLNELLEDYTDYISTRELKLWVKNDDRAKYIRKLSAAQIRAPKSVGLIQRHFPPTHEDLLKIFNFIAKNKDHEICANVMVCIINQCCYLLDKQIKSLKLNFLKEGGIRERMSKARRKRKD